jgi:hypothetical protein
MGILADDTLARLLKESAETGFGAKLTQENISGYEEEIKRLRAEHGIGEAQALLAFHHAHTAALEAQMRIANAFHNKLISLLMDLTLKEDQHRKLDTALKTFGLMDILGMN